MVLMFRSFVRSNLRVASDYSNSMTKAPDQLDDARSALAEALDAVGDRWTLLIVEALLDGPRRFNDLQEPAPGIAPNALAQRQGRLEREPLAVAPPYSEGPPVCASRLTREGRDMAAPL